MNTVWKVCRVVKDTFRSALASTTTCKVCGLDLAYPLGQEVHPPGGTIGIFCFPEREQAEGFACREIGGYWVVLRCHTAHIPKPVRTVFTFAFNKQWLRGKELLDEPSRWTMPTPTGTVTVPSLTPIEAMP